MTIGIRGLSPFAHRRSGGSSYRRLLRLAPSQRRLAVEPLERRGAARRCQLDQNGDGGSWTDVKNWSDDAVPGASDDVTIDVTKTSTMRALRAAKRSQLDDQRSPNVGFQH